MNGGGQESGGARRRMDTGYTKHYKATASSQQPAASSQQPAVLLGDILGGHRIGPS